MSLKVVSPSKSSSRVILSDWLELIAFLGRTSGSAQVAAIFGIESAERGIIGDDTEPDDSDEVVEREIDDRPLGFALDEVASELTYRKSVLGDLYPFEVEIRASGGFALHFSPKDGFFPHTIYLFQLILSCSRQELIVANALSPAHMNMGARLFHVCASIGVFGAISNGQTFWIGFPRPEKDGFMKAVGRLCADIGFGRAKTSVPNGLARNVKDAAIDIIGWRVFSDRKVGGLVVLCQAASGMNWRDKSIKVEIGPFRSDWFESPVFGYAVPAIALPFVSYAETDWVRGQAESFEDACHTYLTSQHDRLGVILDRFKITEAAGDLARAVSEQKRVAGFRFLPQISQWCGVAAKRLEQC